MTKPRRCTHVDADGRPCKALAYLDGELCWVHSERARKDKQRLPSYGGGVLGKHEARTRTDATPTQTSLYVEPVIRTEPSDGFIEWDDDEHVDPLDRIEDMAHDYRKSRRG